MADQEARQRVLIDLAAESESLEALVDSLDAADFTRPTPAVGWTIGHQLAHLAWTDETALKAANGIVEFNPVLAEAIKDVEGFTDRIAQEGTQVPVDELVARWKEARRSLGNALGELPDDARLPWFGPPMSVPSMATARLMETWAHGEDIADALGVRRPPTARLRHIAHLGFRTRDYAFGVNGVPAPTDPIHVELVAPDGSTWSFGPDDAEQRISGQAVDFCYLVTRRRHPADLDVVASGRDAERWVGLAQAFAGPPGQTRDPGSG